MGWGYAVWMHNYVHAASDVAAVEKLRLKRPSAGSGWRRPAA